MRISLVVLRRSLLLAALVLAPGCGSSSGGSAQPAVGPTTRPSSDLITREEIERGHWRNAYELIEALRPRWLRSRGAESIYGEPPEVQVRIDNSHLGGPSTLREIPVADITSIRFVDGATAAAQWGGDHINGAIVISTKSDD
jgi:hypothetical protein